MLAGSPSRVRPPWFETTTPASPRSTARTVSSGWRMPLTRTGSGVSFRSHTRSAQVGAWAISPWKTTLCSGGSRVRAGAGADVPRQDEPRAPSAVEHAVDRRIDRHDQRAIAGGS